MNAQPAIVQQNRTWGLQMESDLTDMLTSADLHATCVGDITGYSNV